MPLRLLALTAFALTAFAANSLLCRLALKTTASDPASLTAVRLVSGALVLWLLVYRSSRPVFWGRDWKSALALFAYAACFSFAYVSLPAGVGALLLFGAVQISMLVGGVSAGERLHAAQVAGLCLALAGLVWMVLPGLAAPSPVGAALMLVAGVAWGIYSLRGRRGGDPASTTADNFLRAAPLALLLCLVRAPYLRLDTQGFIYALLSGAVTSGLGYIVWYRALRELKATQAAIVQLSVPVLAALGGVLLLGETLTLRLVTASAAILGGVALAVLRR